MLQVINIINKCQQERFTGNLVFKASSSVIWRLYFFSGQIFWVNGGYHPHRFWIRNANHYFPHINLEKIRFYFDQDLECIYYQMLYIMRQRNLITEAEATIIIQNKISDILFDILQQSDIGDLQISREIKSLKDLEENGFSPSVMEINFSEIQTKVIQEYKLFKLKFINNIFLNYASVISLNYAPIILKSQELESQIHPGIYQNIKDLFDGDLSLRDIGFYLQQDIIIFAFFLIPYINNKLIKLIPIKDFSYDVDRKNYQFFLTDFNSQEQKPLISCSVNQLSKRSFLVL